MSAKAQVARRVRASARFGPVRDVYRLLALRGLVPERLTRGIPVNTDFIVGMEEGAGFRYAGSAHDVVAGHLFWGGLLRWERETWREFIPLARQSRGFLDVGAFTGAYTLVASAANPAIRCVAFEPVPAVFERLVTNVTLNALDDRVAVVNAAVAASTGRSRFWLPGGDLPDTGHLEDSHRVPNLSCGDWLDVATTTVAQAVPKDFPIDLVKIDVEDAEGTVVRGMADVLSDHHPTVIIELLHTGSYVEAVEVFDEIGYDYYHLADEGRLRVDSPRPVPDDPCMNFLCVPHSDVSARDGRAPRMPG